MSVTATELELVILDAAFLMLSVLASDFAFYHILYEP